MTLVQPEEILTGGNVSGAVVRVGATVRKLATPATPAVEALLRYLNAEGFAAAPRTLGRDERGRHVCHHDLAPWNLVCDGDRWVFIDWDLAGPGSRRWDLAWAAASFGPAADYIEGHLAEWARALSR
jgi:Ser/Thr protein kinase RdoA (MazF antagonist)